MSTVQVGWTATDFTQAIAEELPTGTAWPRDPDGGLMQWVAGCAEIYGDVSARAAALLIVESDPRYTHEMLPDWERALGLPDPCVKRTLTLPERRQALVNKLTIQGGQSRAFFISVAAALGYGADGMTTALYPGAASRIAQGGFAVVVVQPGSLGAVIGNPLSATDQGIAAAEPLFLSLAGSAGLAIAAGTIQLQPGDTYQVPAGLTTAVTVNAATTGHLFSAMVAQLQTPITIREFRPFQFGLSSFGGSRGQFQPPSVRFFWRVTVTGPRLTRFSFGASSFGRDSFLEIVKAVDLQCVFTRWKPAQTTVLFDYLGA